LVGLLAAAPTAIADDKADILSLVETARRAEVVQRDAAAYLSMWTDDATITHQRGPAPDRYDRTEKRATFEPIKRLLIPTAQPATAMTVHDAVVTVTGDTAQLTWRIGIEVQKRYREEIFELYKLRRTPAGWRAHDCLSVKLLLGPPNQPRLLNRVHWIAQDQRVEQAREFAQHPLFLIGSLMDAHRYQEAFIEVQQVTKRRTAKAHNWIQRGVVALKAGHLKDARQSILKARAMDPSARLPTWARAIK